MATHDPDVVIIQKLQSIARQRKLLQASMLEPGVRDRLLAQLEEQEKALGVGVSPQSRPDTPVGAGKAAK